MKPREHESDCPWTRYARCRAPVCTCAGAVLPPPTSTLATIMHAMSVLDAGGVRARVTIELREADQGLIALAASGGRRFLELRHDGQPPHVRSFARREIGNVYIELLMPWRDATDQEAERFGPETVRHGIIEEEDA